MAASGWVCVSINYRLSPRSKWPDHLIDCKRALAWVKENIAQHGGDPHRIIVTGGSAGGHLAAMLALTPGRPDLQPGFETADTHVQGCAPFYGPFDLTTLFTALGQSRLGGWICKSTFGCEIDDVETLAKASPTKLVNDQAPPFLVIHGTSDTIVPVRQAREFCEALRAVSKQPVLYAELPGAIHAFDAFRGSRTAATVAAVHRFAEWAVSHVSESASPVPDQPDRPASRSG
jgi:acetyl esterase/lipase